MRLPNASRQHERSVCHLGRGAVAMHNVPPGTQESFCRSQVDPTPEQTDDDVDLAAHVKTQPVG